MAQQDHHITDIRSGLVKHLSDTDPEETKEWLESFDGLVETQGTERAEYIVRSLLQRAGAKSVAVPMVTTTDYVNTSPSKDSSHSLVSSGSVSDRCFTNPLRISVM